MFLQSERAAVVIPVRDDPRVVVAVRSAVGQAGRVYVVDDGSTDPETLAVLDSLEDCTLIRTEPHGVCAARNTGMDRALAEGAELIQFLDADDWLPDGKIAAQAAATSRDGSWCAVRIIAPYGEKVLAHNYLDLDPEVRIGFVPQTGSFLFGRSICGSVRWDESLEQPGTTYAFVRAALDAGFEFDYAPGVEAVWAPDRRRLRG